MRCPNVIDAYEMAEGAYSSTTTPVDGEWVIARPFGLASVGRRFRVAWMVFTGQADALVWPGQEH